MMPVYSDDADPVTEVISPTLMVVRLIPGALAVRAPPPPLVVTEPELPNEPDEPDEELAVVAVLDPLLELPHAEIARAAVATTAIMRQLLDMCGNPPFSCQVVRLYISYPIFLRDKQ
jgi:hypothetical protein